VVCFAVWLLLDAPTLFRSAQASPLGARRSAAISILRPIDQLSRALGLSHVIGDTGNVIGHAGNSVLQVEGAVAHRHGAPRVHKTVVTRAGHGGVVAPDGLPPLPTPTPATPLRVLTVGDSLGIDFGQVLVNDLAGTGVVTAVLDGHIDTGLSRPDYFDWQSELRSDLARYQPQAVVVFIGANDPQSLLEGGTALQYGSAAWNVVYSQRVAVFMQAATHAGARVLWVGMPPMADPVLNGKMQVLNGIFQTEAASHTGVTYFASWPLMSDGQAHYATFLPDASGNEVQVREPDGTHISVPGAERLSRAVMTVMARSWDVSL
jgi:lysophospholipase L1-like esterase